MTLETFFEKFDQFADAPGAVAKMRELVLELAVRGRLLPGVPSDQPDLSAAPFPIPAHWRWSTLREAAEPCGQKKPDARFTYVDVGAIDNVRGQITDGVQQIEAAAAPSRARKLVLPDSVLYSTVRPYLRNIAIFERQFTPPAIVSTAFAVLHPRSILNVRFLFYWLRSQPFQKEVTEKMKGVAYPAISDSEFWRCPLPLPPLAEQKRIVAKVDELMALCDRLALQQQERETRHAALARASLARFADAPTPANLPFLFHSSFNIHPSDLRKSILTLAVQGKLVPQDANDELSGSIPEIIPPSPPLNVPDSWRWTEFGEIGEISGGFAFKSGDYTPNGVFILRVTNIAPSGVISKDEAVFLPPEKVTREVERFYLNEGDILLVMVGGSLGKIGLVTSDILPALLNQNLWRIIPVNGEVDSQFLRLITDFAVSFQREITHSTHGHLSREEFRKKPVAFPPLLEQRRIVAKVEQLMALVDALETQLTAARATAANLLSALVTELTTA